MKTITILTLKSALRDPFLLFWSILLPISGSIGLGLFIKQTGYTLRIMTGMMGAGILFYAFSTTVFSILSQRRRGVYNLLRVTPLSLWKYLYSVSMAWTLIALLCAIMVLVADTAAFGFEINMLSIVMLLPVLLLSTLGYILFSFFAASLCRTEAHASMVTNLVSMPLLFCSDAFYSLEWAPQWLKTIRSLNPFQWFVDGMRYAFSLNTSVWLLNLLMLLAMFMIVLLLAGRTFRYTDI